MALIACPECEKEVSDLARACPHCGFPVSEEIGRALAEVTGFDRIKSGRQQLAAHKLQSWSETYSEEPSRRGAEADLERGFFGRHRRAILVGVMVVIVLLQLTILMTAVYR
jgi:hypothetical protein